MYHMLLRQPAAVSPTTPVALVGELPLRRSIDPSSRRAWSSTRRRRSNAAVRCWGMELRVSRQASWRLYPAADTRPSSCLQAAQHT